MQESMDIFWRTILAFVALLLIARVLGKQTVSNMTFHDFATGITLGAIAANLAFNEKMQAWYFILSLAVFTLISFILSKVALKFPHTRKWVSGGPTVIIEKGKILEDNMRKLHYTLDSLNQSLREKDVFNLEEVDYAILETNGKLSVKKKDKYLALIRKDINLVNSGATSFPIEVIMDGKIIKPNLAENNLSEQWLMSQIEQKGKKLSDIFYAVKTTNGNLVLDYYIDNLQHPVDKE
ncbi:DUF421 domain-containing protein [Paenibacillus sp. LMG 31456]|uniref:DUF421 domain-containing protein n=1 Tax=Paenibacillus foliorum TaxID=2654974 RepID=A0A972JYD3_9BACL|nr:DUF421 domain-containing protein [Paenibacillus foliorum]NOU92436.1 DUF421 domain-containing protein [Paenibacillus foliorum]